METFARVRLELDVVCGHGGDPSQRRDEERGGGESHRGGGIGSFCFLGIVNPRPDAEDGGGEFDLTDELPTGRARWSSPVGR